MAAKRHKVMAGLLALAGIAVGLAIATGWPLGGVGHQSGPPRLGHRAVAQLAQCASRSHGVIEPRHVEVVRSSWGAAVRLLTDGRQGGEQDAGEPVEVLAMRGRFTAYSATPPPGIPLPRGAWLTLVVNPERSYIMESVLGSRRPQLWRLGTVEHVSIDR